MTDSQLYSRRLLPKGHGYPLFRPQPSDDLPIEYRRTGASIGDVGVITVDGYFDFIFNICMPADSSINWLGVPDRFDRVVLDTGAIFHARNHHRPGCDISNTTIKKRRLDLNAAVEDNVFLPMGAGATVEITASSKEIAMLLLPQGASRSNLRSLQKFEDYALTHACDWYSFVNGKLGRKVENGSRYLVTGVDKTSSWSVASLESRSEDNQVSMKLTAGLVGSGGVACAWKWQSDNSASLCSGPDPAPGEEDWFDHQTVFLRGYKVAVRPYLLAALKGSIKVSNIDNLKPADILRRSTVVPHAQSSSSKSRVSREGSTPTGSPWDSELLAQLEDSGMFAQLEATADLEPELEPILTIQQYHPSSAINSYLLDIKVI
ncbi:hypothetical protein C8R44DRAFT_196347 [Mycena epipterygia]|nr:hypothetical protein C8R44DRAFT_196347 [Mycena epipterygia]